MQILKQLGDHQHPIHPLSNISLPIVGLLKYGLEGWGILSFLRSKYF